MPSEPDYTSPDALAEWRRLAEDASPGPWHCDGTLIVLNSSVVPAKVLDYARYNGPFMARSHPAAVLALIAECERLQARVDELEGEAFDRGMELADARPYD